MRIIKEAKKRLIKIKINALDSIYNSRWKSVAGFLVVALFVAASVLFNHGAWAKFYRTNGPTSGFSYGYGYGYSSGYGYGYGYYRGNGSSDYGYLMADRYPVSTVGNITKTSADITVKTNYKALVKIEYGLSSSSLKSETPYTTLYATSSTISLAGLNCGSVYYYKSVVKDTAGNEWEEVSEHSFNTASCPSNTNTGGDLGINNDLSAPIISQIEVNAQTSTAVISWQTNEPSISWIIYGLDTGYGYEVKTDKYITSHSMTLTGLKPGTAYHYQVKSEDNSGNIGSYTDKMFTTLTSSSETVPVKTQKTQKPISKMTVYELRTRISEIMEKINTLKEEIAKMQQGTNTQQHKAYNNCSIVSFNRDLSKGMIGKDVKCLQIILNSDNDTRLADSGVGSPGNETLYFGALTKSAVIKFQEKYADEILTPWGLNKGTGYVGKTTRAKLNKMLAAKK